MSGSNYSLILYTILGTMQQKWGEWLVSYNSIKYGDKLVTMKNKALSSSKPIWFSEINMSRTRDRYLLMTANKSEYEMDSHVITIYVSSRIEENSDEDGK